MVLTYALNCGHTPPPEQAGPPVPFACLPDCSSKAVRFTQVQGGTGQQYTPRRRGLRSSFRNPSY